MFPTVTPIHRHGGPPRRVEDAAAEHLPAIATAATADALWETLLDLCGEAGGAQICFIDMLGCSNVPIVRRASFTPQFCLDALRRDLLRQGAPLLIDAATLALPCFGPQGLEGAFAIRFVSVPSCLAEWKRSLGTAFQLAYGRYRQLRPLERSGEISLSEREQEIMIWVMRGKSNAVIAEILGISASTVDTYMRRIFRKLEVADRTSAAMRAVAIGAVA